MKSPGKKFWFLCVIFLLVFTVHFDSKVITSSDSRWAVPTAFSIIKEHTANLDQFHNLVVQNNYYAIDSVNHHYYSKYPIGTSLMAVPFVYVIDKFCTKALGMDIYTTEKTSPYCGLELFIASFIVALTSVFIFLIAHQFLSSYFQSLIITFIFAFCTSAWSTASRALWQHGPSMLALSITLYLILKAKKDPRLIIWSSLPLAFSYVIRPTDFLAVLFITLFVFINYRKYFIRFVMAAMLIAIPFFLYNYSIYGTLLTPYYFSNHEGHSVNYAEAILGNLISPARGLFVFSPVLLFCIIGMIVRIKNNSLKSLDFFLAIMLIAYVLLFSYIKAWWGGWCFGPRYFTDVLPFLIYFLIAAFEWINQKRAGGKFVFRSLLIILTIISFYINYKGATHWATWEWNYKPNYLVNEDPRLWQWNDLQFLR